MKVWQRHSAMT